MMTFNKKITVAYNKSFPFKRLSKNRAKDKPWIATYRLTESIKQKHLLFQKFIFDSSEENKVAYKLFKNKLRTVIRKAEARMFLTVKLNIRKRCGKNWAIC